MHHHHPIPSVNHGLYSDQNISQHQQLGFSGSIAYMVNNNMLLSVHLCFGCNILFTYYSYKASSPLHWLTLPWNFTITATVPLLPIALLGYTDRADRWVYNESGFNPILHELPQMAAAATRCCGDCIARFLCLVFTDNRQHCYVCVSVVSCCFLLCCGLSYNRQWELGIDWLVSKLLPTVTKQFYLSFVGHSLRKL